MFLSVTDTFRWIHTHTYYMNIYIHINPSDRIPKSSSTANLTTFASRLASDHAKHKHTRTHILDGSSGNLKQKFAYRGDEGISISFNTRFDMT